MYFDAVLDSNLNPLFYATESEVKEYLTACRDEISNDCIVIRGSDLRQMTVEKYLQLAPKK